MTEESLLREWDALRYERGHLEELVQARMKIRRVLQRLPSGDFEVMAISTVNYTADGLDIVVAGKPEAGGV